MKSCQGCNDRPATVHFTQVVNGEKSEMHLCEVCARERGDINLMDFPGAGFNLNNLLAGLMNMELGHAGSTVRKEESCPTCGSDYRRFAEGGRLGCADCYKTFAQHITPLLKRIHGNSAHQGKVPSTGAGEIKIKRQLAQLRSELKTAVENELYERAVELRDQIRALESESEA